MRRIALLALIVPFVAAGAQRAPYVSRSPVTLNVDRSALEDSLLSIQSSTERTRALRQVGQTTDRATLLTVIRVARTIPNSTEKAHLLADLSPRYLARGDRTLSDQFFRVARTVPSSEELRDLMISVVPFALKSDDIANSILDVARLVPSSEDRADVLIALITSGAALSNNVRENFAEVLQELPAERDRQRVARAGIEAIKG